MKTQEDFKRAIGKFLTNIKNQNDTKTQTEIMKDKFVKMDGDSEAFIKNLIWNKMKNSFIGQKILTWFANALEKYSDEH